MAQHRKGSLTLSKWLLFTTLGWVIGFIIAMIIVEPLETMKLEFFGLGVGISAGIGWMQWVVLKRVSPVDSKWAWITIAGMGSSFLLFDIIIAILKALQYKFQFDGAPFMIAVSLATALGSYFIGYLQEKLLLKKYFTTSDGWTLHTFLGWTICVALIAGYFTLFGRLHLEKIPLGALLNTSIVIIGGPVIGYFTGKKMVKILKIEKEW